MIRPFQTSRIVNTVSLCMMVAVVWASMALVTKTAVAFRPIVVARRNPPSLATRFGRLFASVTGSVYETSDSKVVVTLYTKEGCTLCDKVKDVLQEVKQESESGDGPFAHSLRQIDITDENQKESFDRYKYDIPVLHIGYTDENKSESAQESVYWTKHRLTKEEAKDALAEAIGGSFEPRDGRPNAAAMER